MGKLRVLFVDDEPPILEGIQDLLRKDRARWDVSFATGGETALRMVREQAWDVVVTDMRMPGVDGGRVLEEVKRCCPHATRVVLSGHSSFEAIQRAIPLAHQYIAKPCDSKTLRVLLETSEDLLGVMSNPELRSFAGKLNQLPSAPTTYIELTAAASDPNKGIADLAAILERDPAMSIKVLQLVNSAYFGLARKLSSVQQAASYLGIETLKGLTLAQSVFGNSSKNAAHLQRCQEQALATAAIARSLLTDPREQGEAYTAAIIQDVGHLVIWQAFSKRYKELLDETSALALEPAIEHAEWGVSHCEVGAYLLGSWGLPPHLVAAAAFHHEPSRYKNAATNGSTARTLGAIHVAGALVEGRARDDVTFDIEYLRQSDLMSGLETWKAKGRQHLASLTHGGKNGS